MAAYNPELDTYEPHYAGTGVRIESLSKFLDPFRNDVVGVGEIVKILMNNFGITRISAAPMALDIIEAAYKIMEIKPNVPIVTGIRKTGFLIGQDFSGQPVEFQGPPTPGTGIPMGGMTLVEPTAVEEFQKNNPHWTMRTPISPGS